MRGAGGKIVLAILSISIFTTVSIAQTTAFNFQGRLNDGSSPANGRYDLQFKLFTAIVGGSQVGATVDRPNLLLINGVFSTTLNFGSTAFTGSIRFIEISVRPSGSPNTHVILGERQQILSVPYSVRAAIATQADNATNAQNAADATNATNAVTALNSLKLGGHDSFQYSRLNFANSGDLSAVNLTATANLSVDGNAAVTGSTLVNGSSTVLGNSTVAGTSTVGGNMIQPHGSYGSPKALLTILNPAFVGGCYNGVTGSTVTPCGFTVTEPLGTGIGVYRVNFNFPVAGRFVLATSEYRGSNKFLHNTVPQYQFLNATTIEFFLTRISSPQNTFDATFMVLVF